MYLQSVIPFVMTLPMAVYYGYHAANDYELNTSETPSVIARSGIRDIEQNLSSCNCKHPFRFSESGIDVMSKLIEIDIPKESRMEIMSMLDTLQWIEVENNVTDSNLDFIQKIKTDFLDKKEWLFWLLLINTCSFVVVHIIVQNSILGVLLKIITSHITFFIFHPLHLFSVSADYITGRHATADDSCDDDMFIECSLINLKGIHSEEVLPKGNQQEEKRIYDPCISGSEDDKGSFLQSIHDSSCKHNNTRLCSSTLHEYDSECTAVTDVSIPEKFKQFLHQKQENMDRLGISFTEDDYNSEDADCLREINDDRLAIGIDNMLKY